MAIYMRVCWAHSIICPSVCMDQNWTAMTCDCRDIWAGYITRHISHLAFVFDSCLFAAGSVGWVVTQLKGQCASYKPSMLWWLGFVSHVLFSTQCLTPDNNTLASIKQAACELWTVVSAGLTRIWNMAASAQSVREAAKAGGEAQA